MEPDKEFVHAFGQFLLDWTSFTTLIELLLIKELQLPYIKGHILCEATPFGKQLDILKAVLSQNSPADVVGIKLISDIVNHSKRNFLTHGLINFDMDSGDIIFTKRDVRGELRKTELSFNRHNFKEHVEDFLMQKQELITYFKISDDEIEQYITTARNLGSQPQKAKSANRAKQQQVLRSPYSTRKSRRNHNNQQSNPPSAPVNGQKSIAKENPKKSFLNNLLGIKS